MKHGFTLTTTALLVLASVTISSAATVTMTSVRADCDRIFANTQIDSRPIIDHIAATDTECGSSASARAGYGYVGASASANGRATPGAGGGAARASAGATATYDISFLTPASYAGGLISVSVNFEYDGFLNVSPKTDNLTNLTASASYLGFFRFKGRSSNLTVVSDKVDIADSLRKTVTAGDDDTTVALGVEAVPVTQSILIDPRLGGTVTMNMQANASTAYDDNVSSSASSSFYDTLSFAKSGPVFNLPEGFSVFSVDANIVDNVWVDPRVPAGPAVVPVPASFLLLLTGGLALGATGNRTRKNRGSKPGVAL